MRLLTVLLSQAIKDGRCEDRNIFTALTQRRHMQSDNIKPVIQILTELAGLHARGEILVRGTNHANINGVLCCGTNLAGAFLLDRAQKLYLHRERQISHLVQKKGPAIGCLEETISVSLRSGKGALFVTEEFALHQILRDGAAIYRDKGPVPPRSVFVNKPCRELFTTARFARDINRGLAAGQLVYNHPHLSDRGTASEQTPSRR